MPGSFVSVKVPKITRRSERGAEADVRITMLCAPLHGFRTKRARNPHWRMRLLIGQCPRINVAIVKMLAFVAPRAGSRPGLHYEVVGFVEHFAVVRGIG